MRKTVFAMTILCIGTMARATTPYTPAMPYVAVRNILAIADQRLREVDNPPKEIEASVRHLDGRLIADVAERMRECSQSVRYDPYLSKTKKYVDAIAQRLLKSSMIQNRAESKYGFCIDPTWNLGMNKGPELKNGRIILPIPYILGMDNEGELAAIIAHEMGHFLLHHEAYKAIIIPNRNDLELAMAQRQELEADQLAMRLLLNASYDVKKSYAFTILTRDKSSSQHPSIKQTEREIDTLTEELETNPVKYRPDLDKDDLIEYRPKIRSAAIPNVVLEELEREMARNGRPWSVVQKWYFRHRNYDHRQKM